MFQPPRQLLVAACAALLLLPSFGDAPAPAPLGTASAEPPAAAAPPAPAVRLEHVFIEVDAGERPPRREVKEPARVRRARLAAPIARRAHVVTRTARLLVGDGRYRPEPFPKPAR